MKNTINIIALLLLSITAFGQHTYQGKIEYERKTNLKRVIDDMDEENKEWIDRMRSKIPSHSVRYYDLDFTTKHSMYQPGREPENSFNMWFARSPANEKEIYTDFTTNRVTALKHIYEEKFLVKDTARKIEWKVMDEIRMIANYKCRKAVGVICDSVYVIAFYTDDIMVSGGPEMFGGLPGMILQIAVPRLHTTWIATKVDVTPEEDVFKVPKKGKEVTQKEMFTTLNESLERWGDYAYKAIWWSML